MINPDKTSLLLTIIHPSSNQTFDILLSFLFLSFSISTYKMYDKHYLSSSLSREFKKMVFTRYFIFN